MIFFIVVYQLPVFYFWNIGMCTKCLPSHYYKEVSSTTNGFVGANQLK